jgi:hypothetical protein
MAKGTDGGAEVFVSIENIVEVVQRCQFVADDCGKDIAAAHLNLALESLRQDADISLKFSSRPTTM